MNATRAGFGRMFVIEPTASASQAETIRRIVNCYSSLARWYALIRFQIIPPQMLDAMEQHLPDEGCVLDVGCGFGLTTLYFAMRKPRGQFIGLELSEQRVNRAREAAAQLGLTNIEFVCADLSAHQFEQRPVAAYCVDLLRHLTPEAGDRLLAQLYQVIQPGGKLIVKDITTRPRLKLYFTFLLDLLMCPKDQFFYRNWQTWQMQLASTGFVSLTSYPLNHWLPYPHFLLIGQKPEQQR